VCVCVCVFWGGCSQHHAHHNDLVTVDRWCVLPVLPSYHKHSQVTSITGLHLTQPPPAQSTHTVGPAATKHTSGLSSKSLARRAMACGPPRVRTKSALQPHPFQELPTPLCTHCASTPASGLSSASLAQRAMGLPTVSSAYQVCPLPDPLPSAPPTHHTQHA
jgi:hypothetical protein